MSFPVMIEEDLKMRYIGKLLTIALAVSACKTSDGSLKGTYSDEVPPAISAAIEGVYGLTIAVAGQGEVCQTFRFLKGSDTVMGAVVKGACDEENLERQSYRFALTNQCSFYGTYRLNGTSVNIALVQDAASACGGRPGTIRFEGDYVGQQLNIGHLNQREPKKKYERIPCESCGSVLNDLDMADLQDVNFNCEISDNAIGVSSVRLTLQFGEDVQIVSLPSCREVVGEWHEFDCSNSRSRFLANVVHANSSVTLKYTPRHDDYPVTLGPCEENH
jgi:hypothetical protein